jgi:tryptophanyl-tRNA synthetase
LKNKLSEALVEVICPVGKKMQEYLKDKGFLEKVLKDGTEKANKIAQANLKEIRDTVGFL